MRLPNSGRGVHPTLRPSSIRAWFLDQTEIDNVRNIASFSDLMPLQQLASEPLPAVVNGWVGASGRRGDSAAGRILASPDASADTGSMIGEVTVIIWGRQLQTAVADQVWLRHGGPEDSALAADNVTFGFRISSNGKAEVFWENGAGSLVSYEFDFLPASWETYMIALRRRSVGGGNMEVDLFVNQKLVETSTPLAAPDGGFNATVRWALLGSFLAALTATSCADADVFSVAVYNEALGVEEIREEHRRGTLLEFYPRADIRVEVEDGNGDFVDLTSLDRIDWVDSVTFSDAASDGARVCSIELLRAQRLLSNAILRTDSKLNLTNVDDVTSYDPLLQLTREFKIYVAWIPLGLNAEGRDWMLMFDGTIDSVNSGGEKTVIRGRDLVGRLVDTHIEEEVLNPAIANPLEPEIQYSYGLNTGEPQENVIQKIFNDNDNDTGNDSVAGLEPRIGSYDPITLVTTAPSVSVLKPFRQTRVPVYTAAREIGILNGGDVKYVWNEELGSYAMTLFIPGRDRLDADVLLEARDILNAPQVDLDVKDIRTAVRTTYLSSETSTPVPPALPAGYSDRQGWSGTDGDDNRLPAFYEIRNDAALSEFKRRFMELGERQTKQLDTIIEVSTITKAAIDDLSEPDLVFSAELPLFPMINVGDIIQLRNEELFTTIQTLAVTAVDHSFGAKATTKIGLRGKPTIGLKRWLQIEQVPGVDRPSIIDPRLALFDVDQGPQLRVQRQIYDNTRYNSDAKNLLIPNRDFASWSAGSQNPPDAWAVNNGAWVTDMNRSASSFSGTKSVRLEDATGVLQSKTFDMQGDAPYSFEIVWQRTSVGSNVPMMTIEWLDANDAIVDSVDLEPGGVLDFDFPAVPTTAGTWFYSRTDGVVPGVTTGVRGRIKIGQIFAGADVLLINSVNGYRSAYSAKMNLLVTLMGAPGAAQIVNMNMSGTTAPPNEWDSSGLMINDTASPAPHNGWHFLVPESGRYDVVGSVSANNPVIFNGTIRMKMVLVKNGTFSAVGVLTAGTVVAEGDPTDIVLTAGVPDGNFSLTTTVQVSKDDRLALCATPITGANNNTILLTGQAFYEVTQRLTQ